MWAGLRTLLPGAVILAVALVDHAVLPPPPVAPRDAEAPGVLPLRTADAELDAPLAAFIAGTARGGSFTPPSHPVLSGPVGPTYAALRAGGLRLAEGWGAGATRAAAVQDALEQARAAVPSADRSAVDTVELSIGAPVHFLDGGAEQGQRLSNVHRGVLGLQVDFRGQRVQFAPTQMIADNLGFSTALERAATTIGVSPEVLESTAGIGTFGAEQVLVTTDPVHLTWMFRGSDIVELEAVTARSTATLAASLGDWLIRNVRTDGRMTYAYWPSRGEESTANNTIRQWMATIALGRVASARNDDAIFDLARTNIEYNLAEFYEKDGRLGLIVEADGDVKLGAVALAALAIIEHPDRARFQDEEEALRRTVDALWQPDGSFRTFHRPETRNDNQNFYPGEALLLWARLLEEKPEPELLDRFMQTFRYYRDWHRDQRNPAFVPWHTQAYVALWELTDDPDLKAFVYEMNDWLLALQQWEDVEYPDLRGRFYDPARAQYGPPHAASDGVYLEGLIAAYRMAVADGDEDRTARYRLAINRSIRNLMQLQFSDDIDQYYVSLPEAVLGGVRTTPYDNEIRVDNVQHTLMGVLEVARLFEPGDYPGGIAADR